VAEAGVRSFPSFYFFVNGEKKDEFSGADPAGLEAKVVQWDSTIPRSFEGSGFSLGGGAVVDHSAEAARQARLKRFGGGGGDTAGAAVEAIPMAPKAVAMEDDDAELQKALALSVDAAAEPPMPPVADAASSSSAAASSSPAANVLPTVDEVLLAEAVSMGFSEVRVRKALMAGNSNAEAVVNWVIEHEKDAGIDDPIPLVPAGGGGGGGGGTQKSWKCVETGRLFRTMDEVQAYAERTGRSNFEESTEEKKALTPEEVAAKLEALKAKIAAKREERGEVR